MTSEADQIRSIDADAAAALAAVPGYLRTKQRTAPAGSTRLVFSARPAPDTRKARSHDRH